VKYFMATVVKLPQFGMGMSEAQVVRWYKRPGDPVVKGEPLLEVEAAKSVNDIPAPASGVLATIVAQVGDVVQVYEALGLISAEGDDVLDAEGTPSAKEPLPIGAIASHEVIASPAVIAPAAIAAPAATVAPTATIAPVEAPSTSADIGATPRARRLAREHGLDLATVRGTGSGGRVTDEDVQRALTKWSAGE
jgi:pyruvate/2-oxoglutarate dehydrogenase complex dihydrolipoamide acyltransferase (E2) component